MIYCIIIFLKYYQAFQISLRLHDSQQMTYLFSLYLLRL